MESESASGVSLQEYLLILRRRHAIILQVFVLILVVGVVMTLMTKPVYQSSARLLVEPPSMNVSTVDASNPLSGILAMTPQQTVATQVEVLQSEPFMQKVMQQAGPARISVAAVGTTNIIEADAEATDPKIAAAAPNTLLRLYIQQDINQDLNEIKSAEEFARTQGANAHRRLLTDESRIERFMKQNNVVELTLNRNDEIARINTLTEASQTNQAALSALQAQIATDRHLLTQEPTVIFQKLQASNTAIAGLKSEIARLQVLRVSMTQQGGFTAASPQVTALDAQIAELQRQLQDQPALTASVSSGPNAVRETLRGKIQDLSAQVSALTSQQQVTAAALASAKASVSRYPGWQATLDRLTRDHDAAAAQDKMFSDKLADLSLREQAHHASARIIEMAQVPAAPVRPKKMQSILFAALIGLFAGICLALLQEFLDDRINSVQDADRLLGLPSLGHVPALAAEDARLLPQMQGLGPGSESYRVLRTNIQFASVDAPARTLLVTSSTPGEGKTTTAVNLAFAMVMDGKTVVLVDTDLRRPTLHKLLNLPALPGLTDVLLGRAALQPQEVMPGLSVLTAGSTPPNPGELLNSRTFRNLVDTLAERADLVIFDSPPVLAAADAAILASQMDGTVLVVETGRTKKAAARRASQMLAHARANVLGIAYNKMRPQDANDYHYQYYSAAPSLEGRNGRQSTLLPSAANSDADAPRPVTGGREEDVK